MTHSFPTRRSSDLWSCSGATSAPPEAPPRHPTSTSRASYDALASHDEGSAAWFHADRTDGCNGTGPAGGGRRRQPVHVEPQGLRHHGIDQPHPGEPAHRIRRSEVHTSEPQSHMRITYTVI